MSVDTLLIFSGVFVAILPFLGFPNSWDRVIFLFLGIFVVALGIVVRRRGGNRRPRSDYRESYSESVPARHEEETLAQ